MKMIQTMLFYVPPGAERPRPKRQCTDGRGRHENSLAARGDRGIQEVLTGRRAQVAAWLAANGPATDREIARGLFGAAADMNMVRPRVSELLDAGALREVDRVRDAATGMTVRRVAATGGEQHGA